MTYKVAVVVGKLEQARMLGVFTDLPAEYAVNVYAIDNPAFLASYRFDFPVHVFAAIDDMPGYMRGLEDYVADADVLIGFETSALATFQMVRIAKKLNKPFAVVANEFHPYFYANYQNLRAIQVDILQNTKNFWVTSQHAASLLKLEGVEDTAVTSMTVAPDSQMFQPSAAKRKKFREYIGLKDELVLLFHGELTAASRASELLDALRLFLNSNPRWASTLRLMFVGEGECSREMKYKCFDLKLGENVIFLHQDAQAFVTDLYAACDVLLVPRIRKTDLHEPYPLFVQEAMATGMVPVVGSGTVVSELVGERGKVLSDDSYQYFAEAIDHLVTTPGELSRSREKVLNTAADPAQTMAALIETLVAQIDASHTENREDRLKKAESMVDAGQYDDALVEVEDWLLTDTIPATAKAEAFRLRGDIYAQLNRHEDALEAFQECIQVDKRNYRGYRGLGYLAFKGHSHEEAITFFRKALAQKEDDEESLLGVGLVHRRLGLNEESLFWLERCVSLNHDNNKAVSALLQACMECADPARPIDALQRLHEVKKDHSRVMLTLGQLYLKDGQTELGTDMVAKALALESEDDSSKPAK